MGEDGPSCTSVPKPCRTSKNETSTLNQAQEQIGSECNCCSTGWDMCS